MKLYDILFVAHYDQKFCVALTNAYDQNVIVGKGTRADMLDENNDKYLFWNLMDEVDEIEICGDILLVIIKNEHHDERLETQYSERYVKTWDKLKPETRPYLFRIELHRLMEDDNNAI